MGRLAVGWARLGLAGLGWDGMGWDGLGWARLGWDEMLGMAMGCCGMGWDRLARGLGAWLGVWCVTWPGWAGLVWVGAELGWARRALACD